MTIAVASGKGGTGKTTFSVNLAVSVAGRVARTRAARVPVGSGATEALPARPRRHVHLLDCDVEEPNANLFLHAGLVREFPVELEKPVPVPDTCIGCNKCVEACNFNAIAVAGRKVMIFDELCHGCGVCTHVCPVGALEERPVDVGSVQIYDHRETTLIAGKVRIGHAASPDVISAVKEYVSEDAINIIDAPPGTTCPVVAAVEGSDAVVLVTEPTPFGLHDLALATGLTQQLEIPAAVVVNQSDGRDTPIVEFAREAGLPIAGRIPYRRLYAEAYSEGLLLAEAFPEFRDILLDIYDNLTVCRAESIPSQPVWRMAGNHPSETPAQSTPEEIVSAAPAGKEVVVISGKGGTGKTSITAAFSRLAKGRIVADADVDAADLHLLLHPDLREVHPFVGSRKAIIDPRECTGCGLCADACRFNAIEANGPANDFTLATYRVQEYLCEGCGLCSRVCPADAVHDVDHVSGEWYFSSTRDGPMVHACLGIAEENSGRLVTAVRTRAGECASEAGGADGGGSLILTDGPPGTGCPVTASVTGCSLVVVVTEPTVAGVHDLERVLELTEHFGLKAAVIINKADLNPGQCRAIRALAENRGARLAGTIPYDRRVTESLRAGGTILDVTEGETPDAVRAAWESVRAILADIQS